MPAIVREGDICTGHGCWPPRPAITSSRTVFLDGRGVVRQGDRYAVHCKPCGKNPACHTSFVARGSSSVFVDGIPAARVGDPIACGSLCSTGSLDVSGGG
jgi:uncharacterized Zn-binding protein involved in type VI secretion